MDPRIKREKITKRKLATPYSVNLSPQFGLPPPVVTAQPIHICFCTRVYSYCALATLRFCFLSSSEYLFARFFLASGHGSGSNSLTQQEFLGDTLGGQGSL